jgi:hypothetical protein
MTTVPGLVREFLISRWEAKPAFSRMGLQGGRSVAGASGRQMAEIVTVALAAGCPGRRTDGGHRIPSAAETHSYAPTPLL